MSKLAFLAAGSILALAACGGSEPAPGANGAAEAGTNPAEPESPSANGQPAAPVEGSHGDSESVPPPDAVSHPDGYLPPAPDGTSPPAGNSAAPGAPATEDEYLRNGR